MQSQLIRVLLVDDDEIDRESLARHIDDVGLPYSLVACGSKKAGLAELERQRFDVVLLDFELGDGTGLELLSAVPDTPAILITGCGSEEVAIEAMRLGASDYLIKDTERSYLTVLPITIENVLARKRVEDERERLIVELQEALAQVKSLRGILPICGHCKKIRNDQGYWSEVEQYVSAHSEAEFSHGYCPECLEIELENHP